MSQSLATWYFTFDILWFLPSSSFYLHLMIMCLELHSFKHIIKSGSSELTWITHYIHASKTFLILKQKIGFITVIILKDAQSRGVSSFFIQIYVLSSTWHDALFVFLWFMISAWVLHQKTMCCWLMVSERHFEWVLGLVLTFCIAGVTVKLAEGL